MEYTIRPLPPFDFTKMLQRLLTTGKSSYAHIDLNKQLYRRYLQIGSKRVTLEVTSNGEIEKPVLTLRVPEKLNYNEQNAVVNQARRMFSIDTDLHRFYDHLAKDEVLKQIVKPNYGLRLILDASLFESLIKAIISQQLSLTVAATLMERFLRLCAEQADAASLLPFPTPEQTAALDYEQLRSIGFSQKKAEYIIDTARLIVNGQLDLEGLRRKPLEEIMDTLLPIRGIGRWTVENILFFGIGHAHILPAADIGLRNAVSKVYDLEHQPVEQEIRELGAQWVPWETYTTLYLWESLHKGA